MMTRRSLRFSCRRKIGAETGAEEGSEGHPNNFLRPILVKSEQDSDDEDCGHEPSSSSFSPTGNNDSERTTTRMTHDDEDSVESPSSSSPDSSRRTNRRKSPSSVTFESVTVREFSYEWGDHPFTREGVPLSLSWEPFDENSFQLDAYESARHSPPGFPGNVLTPQQRRDILIRAGYAPSALLQAEADLDETRKRQTNNVVSRQLQGESRRHRQRRFVKELCSLRFGISASASYRRKRGSSNNNNRRLEALVSAR